MAENNYRENKLEIIELRNKMMDLTVQVLADKFYKLEKKENKNEGKKKIVDKVKLSRYQSIPVLSSKYNYDSDRGLSIDI